MRSFDAERLGTAEADAWVAYYQRRWGPFLRAAVTMVRVGFALGPSRSVQGAWYVLKANQMWAPFPDNDADGASAYMRRFYDLVARVHGESFDIDEAARLEIGWWRAHRELQHVDAYPHATGEALVVRWPTCTPTSTTFPRRPYGRRPRAGRTRCASPTRGSRTAATRPRPRSPRSGGRSSTATRRCGRRSATRPRPDDGPSGANGRAGMPYAPACTTPLDPAPN